MRFPDGSVSAALAAAVTFLWVAVVTLVTARLLARTDLRVETAAWIVAAATAPGPFLGAFFGARHARARGADARRARAAGIGGACSVLAVSLLAGLAGGADGLLPYLLSSLVPIGLAILGGVAATRWQTG